MAGLITEAGVERADMERMERMIDREVKARFPADHGRVPFHPDLRG
jgi:hypothetical protein